MGISKQEDLKLKIGNLVLAIWLGTVPTAITYGVFSLHGLNICRTLNSQIQKDYRYEVKDLCDRAAWETTQSYIILIGFFITLPTWYWFYLNMKMKKVNALNKSTLSKNESE